MHATIHFKMNFNERRMKTKNVLKTFFRYFNSTSKPFLHVYLIKSDCYVKIVYFKIMLVLVTI